MDIFITFTLTLIMFAGFMLIIRKPLLWYLKINDHLRNQEELIKLLREKDKEPRKPNESGDKYRKKHRFHQSSESDAHKNSENTLTES